MIFTPTPLEGAYLVDLERHEDERGYLARTWCRKEFEARGLNTGLVQCSQSYSRRRGTLRGLHWQVAPHAEAKLVRCVRGALWDVIVDLRSESTSYGRHFGARLDAGSGRALYVPEGLAHGYVTLEDHTEVFYQMSEYYHPESARGIRWNDPSFSIEWPVRDPILHPRDAAYPDFRLEPPS